MENIQQIQAFLNDRGYVLPYELTEDTVRFFFRTTVLQLIMAQPITLPPTKTEDA